VNEELYHIIIIKCLIMICNVDIVSAGRVGQVWHECAVDVTDSTVSRRSTNRLSTRIVASYDMCTSPTAHVCHASSVDRICHLHDAISRPSSCTLCVCHHHTDLPQLRITGTTLWAWTLLQKV